MTGEGFLRPTAHRPTDCPKLNRLQEATHRAPAPARASAVPAEPPERDWTRVIVVLLVWCALGFGTAVAIYATDASAGVGALIVAFAVLIGAVGWYAAERARMGLEKDNKRRTRELKNALAELEVAQAETVRRLSMAVEFRDEDTGKHVERIGRFSVLLAEAIGMDAEFCERIRHAAPLHDVGKVAIPDHILLKPGPLTPEERAIVETHAEEGHRLVRGSSSAILDMAATIALSHQEKWDGTGYPRGLKGEAIPIEGRIVAVADVFDALTSDRVYRPAFPVEEAIRMMREERGQHFDPVLLDAFMEVLEEHGTDGVGSRGPPTRWRSWRARSRRSWRRSAGVKPRPPRRPSPPPSTAGSRPRCCTPR